MLDKKIKAIKGGSYAGSSTKDGKLYHNLPFSGFENYAAHRGKTRERIRRIVKACNPKHKKICDLGCNVGGISIGMAKAGAEYVLGIDYDDQSLAVAKEVADYFKYNNIDFDCRDINMEFITSMDRFDIIIWLSQWMWIVKQKGMEYAKDLLFEVSKKCDILIFESAADDGKARIVGSTQDDIQYWLEECTTFQNIKREPSIGGWLSRRDLFICREPIISLDSSKRAKTSCIIRSGRNKIKKIYNNKYKWMQKREVKAYKILQPYGHTPVVLNEGDGWIEMEYVGSYRNIDYNRYKDQGLEILKALKETGIIHKDIKHTNLLRLKDKIYLMDFGWCLFKDENPSEVLSNPSLPYEKGIKDKDRLKSLFGII